MLDFNIGLENFANTEHSALFVCAMGVGTVFIGLILLILVCKVMGVLVGNQKKEQPSQAQPIVAPASEQPIENKQELIAAISAAVAEELGTDVNGIRIHSIKKL